MRLGGGRRQRVLRTELCGGWPGRVGGAADGLDGCERILRDEFKDYPESALYMIGAISEAKGKAKPNAAAAPAKPDAKPDAKNETKSAAEKSSDKRTLVPPLNPDAKPQPKVEHDAHAP